MYRHDRRRGLTLLALAATLLAPVRGWAGCDSLADRDAVAATRALAESLCDCATATTVGSYSRCVRGVAFNEIAAGRLPLQCKPIVTRCAVRSTCGRRSEQAVTCVRTNHLGKASCKVVGLPALCRAPAGGLGCVMAEESCCDALAVGCAPNTTSTTASTSTTTTVP